MSAYFELIERARASASLNQSATGDIIDIPDGLILESLDHINLSILCEILSTQSENESTLEIDMKRRTS